MTRMGETPAPPESVVWGHGRLARVGVIRKVSNEWSDTSWDSAGWL